VNEASPVATQGERALLRLAAERTWQHVGASVVRLPAFYGAASGLHSSIARGSFRMPGNGSNVVSRVHVDDAARFVLAALSAAPRSMLLAGDAEPAPSPKSSASCASCSAWRRPRERRRGHPALAARQPPH